MNDLVIYASKRGSTKEYAEAFARTQGFPILDYQELKQLDEVDRVFYFGSVYAGKLTGIEAVSKQLSPETEVAVISVGLTSGKDTEKLAEIQIGIQKEIPQAQMVHLRGRLSKEQLSFPEKMLLKILNKASNKGAETELNKAINEVMQAGKADFVQLDQVQMIQL
ncbi:hypothetical protein NRIC_20780 [Enterococcus florum]|uniref:Flavodoxin domain-containing protein n=1 Tax=Enterococcus florum TaxID=2480627 RepID=A0A4P5P880_9ENTE|nr:flavodoxin domain-containing protein [Enterococcus florum]GCF94187.1 hypothetical protein NRIC_20780 [Enterococcus florum]